MSFIQGVYIQTLSRLSRKNFLPGLLGLGGCKWLIFNDHPKKSYVWPLVSYKPETVSANLTSLTLCVYVKNRKNFALWEIILKPLFSYNTEIKYIFFNIKPPHFFSSLSILYFFKHSTSSNIWYLRNH